MKRKSLLFVLMAMLLAFSAVVAYANAPSVALDGQPVDVTPVIIDGRTLLPARDIVEMLGGEVGWNGELRQVSVTHGNTSVSLTIDNPVAYVNGNAVELDVPPQIINDSTKIPLRFVAEALGVDVDFVDGVILISTGVAYVPAVQPVPVPIPEVLPEPATELVPEIEPVTEPATEIIPEPETIPDTTQAATIDDNDWLNSPGSRAVWTANRNSVVIHRTQECSNMGSPVEWTKEQALARSGGGRPCQNCWTNRGD